MAQRSKHSYDPELFKAEPPEKPELVKALFCGREKELKRGLETLQQHGDINGRRARKRDKRLWIIHGESRSGKSHLARRILAGLPNSSKRIRLSIPARERLEAVEVMRTLFEQLRLHFETRLVDRPRQAPTESRPWDQTAQLIARAASLAPGVESSSFAVSHETRKSLEDSGNLGAPGIIGVETKSGQEATEGESSTVTLRQPIARDFASYCSMMADELWRAGEITHVVVLVDDVDLLEGYADEQRNGRIQRSILADALSMLHQTPCVDVILTARSWYAYAKKEFLALVDLSQSELTADDLVAIHDRRFEMLAKGLPHVFLNLQTLQEAVADVRGLPGVFLQHLDTAFRAYQDEEEWGERDYKWYLAVFRKHFRQFQAKCPDAAQKIIEAARGGVYEIDVKAFNPFHQTIFDNEFVFQSYYRETTYYTDGLVHKAALDESESA